MLPRPVRLQACLLGLAVLATALQACARPLAATGAEGEHLAAHEHMLLLGSSCRQKAPGRRPAASRRRGPSAADTPRRQQFTPRLNIHPSYLPARRRRLFPPRHL